MFLLSLVQTQGVLLEVVQSQLEVVQSQLEVVQNQLGMLLEG